MSRTAFDVPSSGPLCDAGNARARIPSRIVDAFRCAAATMVAWQQRARERNALAAMDERMRRDLGLTNIEVWNEANKPLWRS